MENPTENHKAEQYFFDGPTLARLGEMVIPFERPALLCAPMLGKYLWERQRSVTILDTDERFSSLPGFRKWDIQRPEPLNFRPDLIFCDPPFFNVKLDRLYRAIMILAGQDPSIPLVLMYLSRREGALLSVFFQFGLQPTDFWPGYVSVGQATGIRMYASSTFPG